MPLTLRPWQWAAIPYLEWLFDDAARRSGRSTAIAVALIRLACRYPRTSVRYCDHVFGRDAQQHVRLIVQELIQEDPLLRDAFDGTRSSFVLNLPRGIPNWVPTQAPTDVFDFNIDGLPPPNAVRLPFVIGGRDNQGRPLDGEPNPSMLQVSEILRGLPRDGTSEALRARGLAWHDYVDALDFALQATARPKSKQADLEPLRTVLDRLLEDEDPL